MSIRSMVLVTALSTLALVGTSQASPADESSALDPSAELLAPECREYDACPDDARYCQQIEDIDCGEPFCRTPENQCDGRPSRFQHVEHWSLCWSPSVGYCLENYIGRYLIECGGC